MSRVSDNFSVFNGTKKPRRRTMMARSALNRSAVIMGVSGSGKSTIGTLLARQLEWEFVEGDAFHSDENRKKMHSGIALTDLDRQAWLAQIGHLLSLTTRQPVILSCSALKLAYRDQLRASAKGLRFLWLDIGKAAAANRVMARKGTHFFPESLIDSQFATLEAPVDEAGVLRLDGAAPSSEIVNQAWRWLTDTAR